METDVEGWVGLFFLFFVYAKLNLFFFPFINKNQICFPEMDSQERSKAAFKGSWEMKLNHIRFYFSYLMTLDSVTAVKTASVSLPCTCCLTSSLSVGSSQPVKINAEESNNRHGVSGEMRTFQI